MMGQCVEKFPALFFQPALFDRLKLAAGTHFQFLIQPLVEVRGPNSVEQLIELDLAWY
tara:strand:- start:3789 stop:3962 length:174 start_codon:yes stop_codon:yes gene_type:complete